MEESAVVLEPARRLIKRLKPLAKQLNEATDTFTEHLKTIEAELGDLGLGLEVQLVDHLFTGSTTQGPEEGSPLEWEAAYLGYGRHGKDWRLMVRVYREREVTTDYGLKEVEQVLLSEMPLLEASRNLRMAAASQIEDLLNRLKEEADTKLTSLKKVTETE